MVFVLIIIDQKNIGELLIIAFPFFVDNNPEHYGLLRKSLVVIVAIVLYQKPGKGNIRS